MIAFNEGTPGAGKSYDAVLTHILPALAKRRQVFARLNGLDVPKIAAHLKMDAEEVGQLLTILSETDVHNLYNIVTRDALVVIDEAHMFWVASRDPLREEWEKFFAEHRHQGLDVLLISQWYKRLHSAVRARVERKAVFTKQSAIGMKGHYVVRYYTTLEPDKFEKVGAKTLKYDKAIFPLYQSVVQGTENFETYEPGSRTVWKQVALAAVIVIPLGIFGAIYLAGIFSGKIDLVPKTEKLNAPVRTVAAPQHGPGGPSAVAAVMPAKEPDPKPPGPAYVWKLSEEHRPRVSGEFEGTKGTVLIIDWRDDQGHVAERLTSHELRGLGVRVSATRFGATLTYRDESIVATRYPLGETYARIPQSRLDAMRPMGTRGAPASFASSRTTRPGLTSAPAASREPLQLVKEPLL